MGLSQHSIYNLFASILVLWLYVTAVCVLWDCVAHCICLPMERFTQDTGILAAVVSSRVKQFDINTTNHAIIIVCMHISCSTTCRCSIISYSVL